MTSSADLLVKAKTAIATGDEHQSEKMYEEIVKAIEGQVGKNQKDIATELQKISRALEAEGQTDHAFMFKQRTCATMLRLSMEERRGSRTMASRTAQNMPAANPPASTTPPASTPSPTAASSSSPPRPYLSTGTPSSAVASRTSGSAHIGRLEFICMPTDDPNRSISLYQKTADSGPGNGQSHGLSIGGTNILFVDRASPAGPVFRVAQAESLADRLAESGFTKHPHKVSTPHGMVIFLIDFAGNTFGLLEG